jgi:phospholipase C
MPFAIRQRVTEIVLAPNQIKQYCLPPTTQGPIMVSVYSLFRPGEVEPLDDGTGLPQGVADVFHDGGELSSNVDNGNDSGGGGSSSHPGMQVLARGRSEQDGLDGLGQGVDSYPTADVALELRCFRKRVQSEERGVLVNAYGGETDGWNIVFRRKTDAYQNIRRRFRVVVTYPSVLPEEERRVPLSFLRNGFDYNWNKPEGGVQYLRALRLEGKKVWYYLEPFFAAMYHLANEGSGEIPLNFSFEPSWGFGLVSVSVDMSLPLIVSDGPILASVGVDTDSGLALLGPGPHVYFELTLNLICPESRTLRIDGLPDAELPPKFWLKMRFYLDVLGGGALIYVPRLSTSLTVDYFAANGTIRDKIAAKLREAEQWLYAKQYDIADGVSLFDKHLKPWLLGNYELVRMGYDAATDELVLTHVGNPVSPPVEASAGDNPLAGRWKVLTNPRPNLLFHTAAEHWAPPVAPLGGEGMPGVLPAVDPGDLMKIEHIVVLMQENRSFDHVLGYLSRDLGKTEVEGLLPGDNDRDWNECDKLEWRDLGIRFKSRRISDTSWPPTLDGPCHSHDCTMEQMADGMKHFVANFAKRVDMNRNPQASHDDAQRVMDYHGRGSLKTYDLLVDNFAICDHWFGSFIGGTLPNRHVSFSGDLNRTSDGTAEEQNSDLSAYSPSERPTFFDRLTARGIPWKLFEHGYSFLRLYRNFTFDVTNLRGFSEFEGLAAAGNLPPVTYIEPDYIEAPRGNDDHAPSDMADGQRMIARIVRALIRGPQWTRTMLIITYDEHGGFYDHLVPPDAVPAVGPDGTTTMRAIPPLANGIRQLGPRVPAFVISPYTPGPAPDPNAPPGDNPSLKLNVSKEIYEHASIAATILRRFCGPRPPYLSDRVSQANDLRSLLPLPGTQPRTKEDFTELLARLDEIADAPPVSGASFAQNRLAGVMPGAPDARDDFAGFMMAASALTGRGRT